MTKTVAVSNLSLGNPKQQVFSICPNPTRDLVKDTSQLSSENISYAIIDRTGKLLLENWLPKNAEISFTGFSKGMYLLKLTTATTSQTLKIIKE